MALRGKSIRMRMDGYPADITADHDRDARVLLPTTGAVRHTRCMSAEPAKLESKARLSAADWEQAALETLAGTPLRTLPPPAPPLARSLLSLSPPALSLPALSLPLCLFSLSLYLSLSIYLI